jgi:hypothetical protein
LGNITPEIIDKNNGVVYHLLIGVTIHMTFESCLCGIFFTTFATTPFANSFPNSLNFGTIDLPYTMGYKLLNHIQHLVIMDIYKRIPTSSFDWAKHMGVGKVEKTKKIVRVKVQLKNGIVFFIWTHESRFKIF